MYLVFAAALPTRLTQQPHSTDVSGCVDQKNVQMLKSEQKSLLSDRSEPHLAFDDHKMLFWPRSSFPLQQTSFSHICVSPLTPSTSHSLFPPLQVLLQLPDSSALVFLLPHLNYIQCPGR